LHERLNVCYHWGSFSESTDWNWPLWPRL